MKNFSLFIVLLLTAMQMSARNFSYDGVNYSTMDNNTCKVTATIFTGTELAIPEYAVYESTNYKVVGIGAKAFDDCTSITTITLPSTLEYIENGAFFKTKKLKTIICKGITPADITASPFASSTYTAATLYVPDNSYLDYQVAWYRFVNVVEADPENFEADGMKFLTISKAGKTCRLLAGSPAYSGDVVVPATVKKGDEEYTVVEIGQNSFDKCTGLTSLTLPNTIKVINAYALRGCTALTSLTLPSSLVFANTGFCSGTNIEEIVFPDAMTMVQNIAFQNCKKLKKVTLSPNTHSSTHRPFQVAPSSKPW